MKRRSEHRWTRREFLKGAALAVAAPHIIPASALGLDGRPAPSERVVLGYLGCGPRGMGNILEQMSCPQGQVAAVCDVWKNRRDRAKTVVDAHYKNADCTAYVDFRELLARPDIDAVGIASTDHWHVPMTIAAAKAGKDAHTEKPLGISIAEDQACREAVKRYGRVFQYGAESRSTTVSRHGAELIRSGRLGKIREIRVKAPNSIRGGSREPRPVPSELDYEMWLGPALWRPYSGCPDSGPGWFHVRDYALGFIAGWAAHPLDLMVWAYDTHTTGPWEVEGTGVIPTEGCNDVVIDWNVRIQFGDGVKMTFQAWDVEPETEPKLANAGNYAQFIGTEGWVALSYRKLVTEPDSLARTPVGASDVHLTQSTGHEANFIECVRIRQTPVDPIDDAVRSDIISHVSDIAIRTGRKIKWDPVKEQIIGDPDAARLMARGTRDSWKV